MATQSNRTSMGGERYYFPTTCWTQIMDARTLDEGRKSEVINEFSRKYWKPVYCYLRRKGYSNEEAKDITQGFFYEIILGRHLVERADRRKTMKFRTYLLTALDRYAASVYERETAAKRSPKGTTISLETEGLEHIIKGQSELSPDQAFNYMWVSEILDQVLSDLKKECDDAGESVYWEIFRERIIAPVLGETQLTSLDEICSRHGVSNKSKASSMIHRLKQRFHTVMRRHLRQFVESDKEVNEEFDEIFEILSKK